MERTYDEIMEDLEENAVYELVVSTARREGDDGEDIHLALVTVDGVTRGVVTRGFTLGALEVAADRALNPVEDEPEFDSLDDEADDESVFDRLVSALESAADLARQLRR